MKKRNLKTRLLIMMRHMGMLCRAPKQEKTGLRIERTVYPDVQLSNIDREIHVYLETKKMAAKGCKFDTFKRVCECGYTMDKFGEMGCKNK